MNKKTIIGLVACLAGLALGIWAYCSYTAPRTRLTIVHVNDTHSQMEPVRSGELSGLGGALERAAFIDSIRTADGPENVLVLHAGDFSQGTSYFSQFRGMVEDQDLNAIGYDAVTLGNHEFDNGIEELGARLSGLEMPIVVCNYDFSPFEMGKYIKPYVIVEKAGKKIGIVGVLCQLKDMVAGDIANRIPAFEMAPTIQRYVDEIRPQCDLVVLLSHVGFDEHNPGDITDQQLAAQTEGIDLIVGGHSHTFMEEPFYARNKAGRKVPIVQVGYAGVRAGTFHVAL
ncbi:MAG: metallophosphoesterase [Bacteroidales bacterium]|nr:metallophosphoesterase [Bacteroidales bacterium]